MQYIRNSHLYVKLVLAAEFTESYEFHKIVLSLVYHAENM
jgi:hypothetical protein